MPKNAQTTAQLNSSHNASKVMLKILQARLQQYMNHELPDVQAGLRKGRRTRDQIANIRWIIEKAKGKGEKERYTHLNAEFQGTARRDKKAFPSDQCKEVEENKMGNTRDLFKKIRDIKGTFHAKMGSIKDRNGMDLTEAEILRRWGKNTQKNCKKRC